MTRTNDDIDVFAAPSIPRGQKYVIPEGATILPPLASQCNCELAVNEEGMAMVMFNKPMEEGIHWVEYDMDLSLLTFVTWSGKAMELGIKIHPPFRKYLKMAQTIMMVQVSEDGKQIEGLYPADLVTRNIGI